VKLSDAQASQEAFDAEHWEVSDDSFSKTRHIMFHLAVLTGKVGRYCEQVEHGKRPDVEPLTQEVIPDLLIYALQLSNLVGISLEDAYRVRLEANRQKMRSR